MRLVVEPSEPDPVRLEASKAELERLQRWIDGTREPIERDSEFLAEAMELASLGRRIMDDGPPFIDPRLFKSHDRLFGVPLRGTWPTEPI